MKHKKLTKEELSDVIVRITTEFTDMYFKLYKKKKIDKQLWAALHIGFIGGIVTCGYDEEYGTRALKIAQEKIIKNFNSSKK